MNGPSLRFISDIRDALLGLCYPSVCSFCATAIDGGMFCDSCERRLLETANDRVCGRCAGGVGPHLGSLEGCDLCRKDAFAFERVLRLGSYRGALASACLKIKRSWEHRLAVGLVECLWNHRGPELDQLHVDAVIPIPLHWRRRCLRGYDQAALLGEHLAAKLKRPCWTNILTRPVATRTQARLAPTERRKNVVGAFRARKTPLLSGSTILLVDDVLTTGATCHQSAKALLNVGAKRVFVAVIARGDNVPGPSPLVV